MFSLPQAQTSEIAMADSVTEPEKTKKDIGKFSLVTTMFRYNFTTNLESKRRIPAVAMKPPGKPLVPKKPHGVSSQSGTPEESKSEDSPSAESKNDDSDATKANSKPPPMSPPAALKPKPKPEPSEEISADKDKNVDDNQPEKPLKPDNEILHPAQSLPPGKHPTPNAQDKSENVSSKSSVSSPTERSKSVESTPEKSENDCTENVNKPGAKSPPMLPPVALKPKPRVPDEISEEKDTSAGENQSSEKTLDAGANNLIGPESLQTGKPQSAESKSIESSPAKSPPLLPPAALKPKVKEDVAKPDKAVDADIQLQPDVKISDRSTKPPAPPSAMKPKLKPKPNAETHESKASDTVDLDTNNPPSLPKCKPTFSDTSQDIVDPEPSSIEPCSPQPSPHRDKPPPSPSRALKPKLETDTSATTTETDFTTIDNSISTPVSSNNVPKAHIRRSLTFSPSAPTETIKGRSRSQTF